MAKAVRMKRLEAVAGTIVVGAVVALIVEFGHNEVEAAVKAA